MDLEQARYIVRYYRSFLTAEERRAWGHLFATSKITRGRTDSAAQEEAWTKGSPLHELLSTDPQVKQLAAAGMDAFDLQTAERIYRDHREEIVFNNCPQCGGLAMTPKARQCRHCHHDWHATS
jgi:hypothetical protein